MKNRHYRLSNNVYLIEIKFMPLVNKNYVLSDFNNDLFITIKNNKNLMEMFYSSLFLAARKSLGFKVKSSSVLIVKTFTKRQLKSDSNMREFKYEKISSVLVEPEKDDKKSIFTTISVSKKFLQLACDELTRLGNESYYINDHKNPVKYPAITNALVEEYWDKMVTFAKENLEYSYNWDKLELS